MERTTGNYTVVSSCDTLEYRHRYPSANFCSASDMSATSSGASIMTGTTVSLQLTRQDGRWYGGGAADNKGQHTANIVRFAP
ncbi:hypothetical protein SAMN05216228_10568 [Rhizobium tibeticum]|uniref:Uncharacterized protein n=1 Tax=Rhizobium tibeticum TaxID=501024 RepID=A0A1H8W786_9HYPH|nr:hypothetical protein RTCCBAU85039_6359 [Rhizobium tibeticum]SEP23469.1 hypothetical protein SAMN05216228_10568 [Rhizobium tibeticum]